MKWPICANRLANQRRAAIERAAILAISNHQAGAHRASALIRPTGIAIAGNRAMRRARLMRRGENGEIPSMTRRLMLQIIRASTAGKPATRLQLARRPMTIEISMTKYQPRTDLTARAVGLGAADSIGAPAARSCRPGVNWREWPNNAYGAGPVAVSAPQPTSIGRCPNAAVDTLCIVNHGEVAARRWPT